MNTADLWLISNGIGGIAFAVLTVLLASSAQIRAHSPLLLLACAVNTAWSFVLALAIVLDLSGPAIAVCEIIRDGCWLVLVAWLSTRAQAGTKATLLRRGTLALPIIVMVYLGWQWLVPAGAMAPGQGGTGFYIGAIGMSLWGLVLLEGLYRGVGTDERWAIKHTCLAVTALFGYDFVMYSYAVMHQQLAMTTWDARGAVNALVAPLIGISARRSLAGTSSFRISHRAAFHTGALVLCGGYLLFLGLGGYYIRVFGGTWSEAFGVLFVVAMLLLLAIALLSGQLRARAKVFISKHFFAYKYDYRQEWLGLTQRLTDATEIVDPYQRSIRAVAHILESPAGALWLLRDREYVCVSHWNMQSAEQVVERQDEPFLVFLRDSRWIVDLDQYRRDPSHYGDIALPDNIRSMPRARLVIPLFFENNLLGFMVLAAPRTRYTLTWEDFDLVKTLGSQVGGFLGQQESQYALAQARQFEAFNQLTAFLMHDLKNIASQQSLIVQNAQKHKHNPEFVDDMIMTVDSSVARMKRLLDQLQRTSSQTDNNRRVEVLGVIRDALSGLNEHAPTPVLAPDSATAWVYVDAERFAMIVGHVVRNAQQATDSAGSVRIKTQTGVSKVRIAIADDGAGMTPEFVRDALFKPFHTTKSARGMGIGAYQAREFARSAGGDVEVTSAPGQGTTVTLILPLAADNTAEPSLNERIRA